MRKLFLGMLLLVASCSPPIAFARDNGQWGANDKEIRTWFEHLMQPDNNASCCGEADAYFADSYEINGSNYVAIITDERDNEMLHRIPRSVGTKITIPPNKLKFNEGNPTGHGIVFLGSNGQVFCYLPPGGV